MSTLSEEKEAEYKEIFNIYDKNDDGSMDAKELGSALQALGQNPTTQEINEMISEADSAKNPNGKVEFNEFCDIMEKRKKEPGQEEEELFQAFKLFDKDGSGFIEKAELWQMLVSQGQGSLSENEANEMMAIIDPNGDGRLSYRDLIELVLGY